MLEEQPDVYVTDTLSSKKMLEVLTCLVTFLSRAGYEILQYVLQMWVHNYEEHANEYVSRKIRKQNGKQ